MVKIIFFSVQIVQWIKIKMTAPNSSKSNCSVSLRKKVDNSLVAHAYAQLYSGILTAQTGATIVLLALYSIHTNCDFLFIWYGLTSILTLIRVIFIKKYYSQSQKNTEINSALWSSLFLLSALVGGLSWGISSILLSYTTTHIQQAVVILTIAAVTAGSIITLSAIPLASFIFLITSLLPYAIEIFLLNNLAFAWSNFIFIIYMMYLIFLSIRMHAMIENLTYLHLENTELLENLSVANKNLSHLATHDPLTNIDNRRLFYINLKQAMKRASRDNDLLAVLYIDLDNFKSVNDKYGHDIGDQLLISVANTIKNTIREIDLVSRIGGDEFTVILEKVGSPKNTAEIVSKICAALALPITIKEYTIEITASIGISLYPLNGTDAKALIKAADNAMYYVKQHGHNNFHFSDNQPI